MSFIFLLNSPVHAQSITPITNVPAGSKLQNFSPKDDSYVDSSLPSTNFGTAKTMQTSGAPGADRTAYVRFQLPETILNYNIQSARLRIRSLENSAVDQYVFYTSQFDWSETKLLYGNKPTIETGVTTFRSKSTGYVDIDVTKFIKNTLRDPTNTMVVTFAVKSAGSTIINYPTKESGNNAMVLQIMYQTTKPTPTPLPLPKLTCTKIRTAVSNTVSGTPTNHPATTSTVAYDDIGPYRGIGQQTYTSSDGARSVWVNKLNYKILYAGEWGDYAGVDKSIDGGLTWKTVIDAQMLDTLGVPRDFDQAGGRVYMVTDNKLNYEENNIWWTCNIPDTIEDLQTVRVLRDGELMITGLGGVSIATKDHDFITATGFAEGDRGFVLIRTAVQDPTTFRIYAGGWFAYDVDPYLYDNPGLWVSDDFGKTFKRHERFASMKGSTGKLPAINSLYVTNYLGRRLIFAGTEGEGSAHGQKGSLISPSIFMSLNDQPFSNYSNIINSPGWNSTVGAGLVTPSRGIFEKNGYLIIGSFCSHFAAIKLSDTLGTNPISWKRLTPTGFKSGLTVLSGDMLITGGQHWGSTIPAFKPVHKISALGSQINTVMSFVPSPTPTPTLKPTNTPIPTVTSVPTITPSSTPIPTETPITQL